MVIRLILHWSETQELNYLPVTAQTPYIRSELNYMCIERRDDWWYSYISSWLLVHYFAKVDYIFLTDFEHKLKTVQIIRNTVSCHEPKLIFNVCLKRQWVCWVLGQFNQRWSDIIHVDENKSLNEWLIMYIYFRHTQCTRPRQPLLKMR